MAEIDEIKSVIKTCLEALNIAQVYDCIPHVSAWDEILKKAVKNNSLNLIMFTYSTRRSLTAEDSADVQPVRGWRVKYLMSASEKAESEKVFDRNIESICSCINGLGSADYTLEIVSPAGMPEPKDYETVCGILCRMAELEFEIIKNT